MTRSSWLHVGVLVLAVGFFAPSAMAQEARQPEDAEQAPAPVAERRVHVEGDRDGMILLIRRPGMRAQPVCKLPCEAAVPADAKIGVESPSGVKAPIAIDDVPPGGSVAVRVQTGRSTQALGATVLGISSAAHLTSMILMVANVSACLGDDCSQARGNALIAGFVIFWVAPVGIIAGALMLGPPSLDAKRVEPNTAPPSRRDAYLDDTRTRAAAAAGPGPGLPGFVQIPVGFSF